VNAPGAFNFARAVREHSFLQLPLLDLGHFRDAAKARGLPSLSLFEQAPWETLDREEFLSPVAYALHGFAWSHELEHHLDTGALLVRDDVGHQPWEELRKQASERFDADLWVLYHHWQLIWLADLLDYLQPSVLWGNLAYGLENFYEMRANTAQVPAELPRQQLREAADAARSNELLLVRVQNWFYPPQRSSWRAGPVVGLTDDAYEWTREREAEMDWSMLADDCGVDAEALTQLYDHLVWKARGLDPNEKLFVLMDAVATSKLERLEGTALRALDLYRAARVIRGWHHELTGEELADVDDFQRLNPEWKRNLYGTADLRNNRAALPAILDDYGLYPYRVQLVGEGDSELTALREVLDYGYGLSFERLGIIPVDVGGADIPTGAERMLAALRVYANYFLLVFDNEGRASELVDELQRRGVVEGVSDEQRREHLTRAVNQLREQTFDSDEERTAALLAARERAQNLAHEPGQAPEFLLWRENLEASNFELAEMCEAVRREAERQGIDGFRLDPDQVEAALAEPGEARAVASVIIELAEAHDQPLRLSKPDFAKALARYAVDNPQLRGETRPLLELAKHLVRLTAADRILGGRLRR
jgi:hypothetical protein